MDIRVLIIIIEIIFISLVVYFIKNFNIIKKFVFDKKDTKIFKICFYFIIILIAIILIFWVKCKIENIIKVIKYSTEMLDNDENFIEEFDQKLIQEEDLYKRLKNQEYLENDCTNPYLLDGFIHIEGEWNTGYVIQDSVGNQYVWVPCNNIRKLNFYSMPMISKTETYNQDVEPFLTSVFKYGGFYISRFEIGKENNLPVSKKDCLVYTNITQAEAKEISSDMYDNINCELINGYAYDTALDWIINNNKIVIDKIKVKDENNDIEVTTGRRMYNNIYDFTDNILELTTETHFGTVIVRGFNYKQKLEKESRYSIFPEQVYYFGENLLAFRTVLYK